jgi:WD40 repeat protein
VAFSPDGQTLAGGSLDKTVRLWDVQTGQTKATLQEHTSLVQAVAFSPDGQTLASGSDDQTVRLWDAKTGQTKATLSGHSSVVVAMAFSPDGEKVYGWDFTNKVLAWTVKDGRPTDTANPPPPTKGLTITSPDGSLRAEARSLDIALIELAHDDPLRDYRERIVLDKINALYRHEQQAVQAEKDQNWFAALFHLNQLLKEKPFDAELRRRRNAAQEKQKPSTPMEPLPRP